MFGVFNIVERRKTASGYANDGGVDDFHQAAKADDGAGDHVGFVVLGQAFQCITDLQIAMRTRDDGERQYGLRWSGRDKRPRCGDSSQPVIPIVDVPKSK